MEKEEKQELSKEAVRKATRQSRATYTEEARPRS